MAHAVSATFTRFEHMSPPAAVLALVLHALVAFLLWWSSPLHQTDDPEEKAIEVTMEAPPPPPKPEPPKPEPPKAAAPKPPPPQATPTPPSAYTPFQPAAPLDKKNEGAKRPTAEAPEAKPAEKLEELAPQKSDAPQQALAQPPAPAPSPPPLEKELPPVEAPPAPLTSRDFPKPAPRTPDPKPQPKPPVQAPPHPPQSALAPSPLSRLPPRGAPPPSAGRGAQPQSPFVNPADVRARNDVTNAYLQRIVYKVELQRATNGNPDWLRLTMGVHVVIARDGRLLQVSMAKSSGNAEADRVMLQTFREASPYAPVPAELPGETFSFTLPFSFVPR